MRNVQTLQSLRALLAGGAAAAALLSAGAAAALPIPTGTPQVNAGGGAPVITSTGSTLQVDLNAQRTIIDWANFNLSASEQAQFRFDQRNWIVLNRVASGAININGVVTAGQAANFAAPAPAGPSGNVWFYSPAGVAFGANARVDVGGLLATSAAVNTSAFLTAGNLNIPFTGSGSGGPVTVAAGANMSGTAHLAFIAPRVDTAAGSNFTVSDYGSVLYGGADTFEVQLFPTFNNDLTIFTFIVPNAAAGTPVASALNIAGTTRSGTIYLAAYSRAAVAGTVINAPGLLTANSSFVEYGQVTITTGRNILLGQIGAGSEAQQVAGVTTGSVTVGEINASGNSNIYLTGTGSLGSFTASKVRAGQAMAIAVQNITIPGGLTVGDSPDPAVGTRRNLFIDTYGTVDIPTLDVRGTLTMARGAASNARTPATRLPNYRLGTVTSGGNMLISNGNDLTAGVVTSGGEAQLFGITPVTLTSLTTNGYTRISSSATINVGTVRGVDLDLRSAGGVNATSLIGSNTVMVGTGGPANIGSITGPSLSMDATNAQIGTATIGGDVRLRVQSLNLTGALNATNFTLEAQNGAFTLGGSGSGVTLPDASFNRIRVSGQVNLYAGQTGPSVNVPTPVFGDFVVNGLTLDPTRVPTLNLYANSDREVRVFGPVDTVGAAAGLIRIGDPVLGSAWAPKTIKIMDPSDPVDFAAGLPPEVVANARRFEFYATGDILIGSQRFVDLVSATPSDQIDLGRGLPVGVAPTPEEANRLYLLGAKLTMAAGGRILTQNTSPTGQEVSIVLTGAGLSPDEPILTLGRAQKAEVFVSLATANGLSSGPPVSLSDRIARLSGDNTSGSIFVNGCALGVGCSLSTPATQFRIEAFEPAESTTAGVAIDAPLLSPPPRVAEEDEDDEAVVTGSGNEEIWRRDK